MESPVGKLKLVAGENGLVAILWENENLHRNRLGDTMHDDRRPILAETERQLKEYFEGKRQDFSISAGHERHAISTQCLASTAGDSFWRNKKLRPDREATRQAECDACGWRSEPRQPNPDCGAVPSCDRLIRKADWLWRGLETTARLLKIESGNGSSPHRK